MAKHKGDIEIGHRMVDELIRLFGTQANAKRQLPCDKHNIEWWNNGGAPGGYMLARLHSHGGDVIYVLTGQRGGNDGR